VDTGVLAAIIGAVSSGGIATVVTALINNRLKKLEAVNNDIDAQVARWKAYSDKNDERIEALERRLEHCQGYLNQLERYILELERIIAKQLPETKLPERPDADMR